MKVRSNQSHEVRIYIGSRKGYHGSVFDKRELVDFIQEIQAEAGDQAGPVRVTETVFVFGKPDSKYQEPGWEIVLIQYPRYPKPVAVLNRFALSLAESLLLHFDQNRISVVFPEEIVMLEADEVQES